MTTLPHALVDQVKNGNVVLFLGAGATYGAQHPKNEKPPLGPKLSQLIASKFLGKTYEDRPLAEVAELAISERDLASVQDFIAEIYQPFTPAPFHLLIPSFSWAAIATTNYDLIVERAYTTNSSRVQELISFLRNEDRVDARLRDSKAVPFLKLHGCITITHDTKLPLILTPDQYVTHRNGRQLLFNRLEEYATNYTFLFVGHRLVDPNLRSFLLQLNQLGDARPRSYLAAPGTTDVESRFWAERKIACIDTSFEDLLRSLNSTIRPEQRALAAMMPSAERRTISNVSKSLSASLVSYLASDLEHIHSGYKSEAPDPKSFYSGHFDNWGPIASDLDVKRRLPQKLILNAVLPPTDLPTPARQFFVLKGHAGAGKTVALRRMAWDAANDLEAHVFVLKSGGRLQLDELRELAEISTKRVFLFVDHVVHHSRDLHRLLDSFTHERAQITVVGTARHAEWNEQGDILEPLVSEEYELGYLREDEIDELLEKLKKHGCLGHLEDLSPEARRTSLEKRAGRQLLVALHEATRGKPFTDIVYDEYCAIPDARARSLYLTVSMLHRLNIPVRAGLISRTHALPFIEFKEHLFSPLDRIVFAAFDPKLRDYVYATRHPHVAEILFERVLSTPLSRFDEVVRLLTHLDTGYSCDFAALRGLSRAKDLAQLFPDIHMARRILKTALSRFPKDNYLLQQAAILEMSCPDGDLELATQHLRNASPTEPQVQHSRAELALCRSERARSDMERARWRSESHALAQDMIRQGARTSHAYHTILKIQLAELQEVLEADDAPAMERSARALEQVLSSANQKFPGDSYLSDAESRFSELLKNRPRALAALRQAFERNPGNGYLAVRLAALECRDGSTNAAIDVLRKSLDQSPNNRDMHLKLGLLLLEQSDQSSLREAEAHFRLSFTSGDARFEAQYHYARTAFRCGHYQEADMVFATLRNAPVSYKQRMSARNALPDRQRGTVAVLREDYGFIQTDGALRSLFFGAREVVSTRFEQIALGNRVTFSLAFNYRGPLALKVAPEASPA